MEVGLCGENSARTLADALKGADVFYGLSAKGAVTKEMVASMAPKPIIFAMANPDPEITGEEVAEVRDDAIMATGRSDYPNQVNNVLGFPYIFRGALDVPRHHDQHGDEDRRGPRARRTRPRGRARRGRRCLRRALQVRARLHYPGAVRPAADFLRATGGRQGRNGHRRRAQADRRHGRLRDRCARRRDPVAGVLQQVFERVRRSPKRVVFAEGEEEQVIRAAATFVHERLGTALLVGREDRVRQSAKSLGIELGKGIEIINAALSTRNAQYAAYLYERLQRQGYLLRDVQRLVNTDRNHFAACMVALDDADAMVTGVTRNFSVALEDVRRVIDPKPGHRVIGLSMVLARGRNVLVADTAITEMPKAQELADIAIEAAGVARRLGYEPRLALLAFSTFGHPPGERSAHVIEAVKILDQRRVDFEYDGEMAADVALNPEFGRPLSVQPAVGAGQRADHAGVPFGVDLHQAAARARRRDRDRPAAGRARPFGADRANDRQGHRPRQHGRARGIQRKRLRRRILSTNRLRGVIAAVATPVSEDGSPDTTRATKLARYLLDNGCDGLNVLGTPAKPLRFRSRAQARDDGLPRRRAAAGAADGRHRAAAPRMPSR